MPVFRRIRARLDLEFFNRLNGRREDGDVGARVLRVHAIESDCVVNFPNAIGDHRNPGAGNGEATRAVREACAQSVLHARNQHGQAGHVTSVQRQFHDPPVLDHLSDCGVLRFEGDRSRPHLDALSDVTEFQAQIGAQLLSGLQNKAGERPRLETRLFALDSVFADFD